MFSAGRLESRKTVLKIQGGPPDTLGPTTDKLNEPDATRLFTVYF